MAYGDPLLNGDQVTRGCSRGYDSGKVTVSAFAMRRGQERRLLTISVDWVECPYADESARNLEGSVNRLKQVPVHPPYAVLRVSDIRQVRRGEWSLDVKEFGSRPNPCHCGIGSFSGMSVDLELQGELAEIANRSPVIEAPE